MYRKIVMKDVNDIVVDKTFSGKKILDNIVFKIPRKGEIVVVTGNNGQGKSTFLKALSGIIKNDAKDYLKESVFLDNEAPMIEEVSVSENLDLYFKITKQSKQMNIEKMKDYFKILSMESFENERVSTLSQGTRAKLRLLFALFSIESFILLDEPFVNLDKESSLAVIKLFLKSEWRQKHALIIVTHLDFIVEQVENFSFVNCYNLREKKLEEVINEK